MSIWASIPCLDGDTKRTTPLVYHGSHVLPESKGERGGGVDLALLPAHVGYYRRYPNGPNETWGYEPYLRLGVTARTDDATVILTAAQVRILHAALGEWLEGLT